jgi:hypothetical protein
LPLARCLGSSQGWKAVSAALKAVSTALKAVSAALKAVSAALSGLSRQLSRLSRQPKLAQGIEFSRKRGCSHLAQDMNEVFASCANLVENWEFEETANTRGGKIEGRIHWVSTGKRMDSESLVRLRYFVLITKAQ